MAVVRNALAGEQMQTSKNVSVALMITLLFAVGGCQAEAEELAFDSSDDSSLDDAGVAEEQEKASYKDYTGRTIDAVGELKTGANWVRCTGANPTLSKTKPAKGWKLGKDRRLTDLSSGKKLDCPEGKQGQTCTCNPTNKTLAGFSFHGGGDRGRGPVHNNLLNGTPSPLYPDANSANHLCLLVSGGSIKQVDNKGTKANCSKFILANWKRL
jgi:hypothetical protein